MRTLVSSLVGGWAALSTCWAAPGALAIRHEPVRCVMAERYPELDACIEPALRVSRARVYFKADAAKSWHYVEMQPVGTCFRAMLPQPERSTRRVRYYVTATDVLSGESRTPETSADVVTDEKSCPGGAVGPFLSGATVVVGGGGLPAGFVGGGHPGGSGLKIGGAILGGGAVAAAAVLARGGAGSTSAASGNESVVTTTTLAPAPTTTTTTTTTTTRPPAPPPTAPTTTTTTTAPPPTTTTTTTTTTTQPPAPTTTTTTQPTGCAADSSAPTVTIQQPHAGDQVGARVDITVEAKDPGPVSSGIKQVRLYAQEIGTARVVAIATLTGKGPTYKTTWTLPSCSTASAQERWTIVAEAMDNCGKTATDSVDVKRKPSSCDAAAAARSPVPVRAMAWASDLGVAGGRGQVVANGTQAVFPSSGQSELVLAPRPGENRIEAVLVDARGTPGAWRFTLASGGVRPGTLRVLAGDVAVIGPEMVVFRLRGRAGERVVFTFEAE